MPPRGVVHYSVYHIEWHQLHYDFSENFYAIHTNLEAPFKLYYLPELRAEDKKNGPENVQVIPRFRK